MKSGHIHRYCFFFQLIIYNKIVTSLYLPLLKIKYPPSAAFAFACVAGKVRHQCLSPRPRGPSKGQDLQRDEKEGGAGGSDGTAFSFFIRYMHYCFFLFLFEPLCEKSASISLYGGGLSEGGAAARTLHFNIHNINF